MLRFFSRRKAKGRAEQKVGAQSAARKPGAGTHKNSKDFIQCSIILLDGSDLSLEIGVRFYFLLNNDLLKSFIPKQIKLNNLIMDEEKNLVIPSNF